MFHDLTAPHLYDQVVVADFVALMRNIETFEVLGSVAEVKVIKQGIKTKKDLLAYVRKIQLVHYPPGIEPTYQKILSGSGGLGWDFLGMTPADHLADGEDLMCRAIEAGGIATIRNDMLAASNSFPPFPKLEKVIIGGNGDELWNVRELVILGGDDMMGSMMRSAFEPVKTSTITLLSISTPAHFCMHAFRGPYAPPFNLIFNPKNPHSLKSFTAHVDESLFSIESFTQNWPVIVCGTVNRWVFDHPRVRYNLADPDLEDHLAVFAAELHDIYASTITHEPVIGGTAINLTDTKLEIHAFADCRPYSIRALGKVSLVQARIWTEEVTMITEAQELFETLLSPEWKGKVELKLVHTAQICECCGYGDSPLSNLL